MKKADNNSVMLSENIDGFWGIYKNATLSPFGRWDPFRTIKTDSGNKIGHHTFFSAIRGKRPHEFSSFDTTVHTLKESPSIDTFCELSNGNLPSIIMSKDLKLWQKPLSTFFSKENLTDTKAYTSINLYTPMARIIKELNQKGQEDFNILSGIPLVHILTKHYNTIEEVPTEEFIIYLKNIILTVNECMKSFCNPNYTNCKVLHFYNIGQRAGASIPHLHSQTLIHGNHKGFGWKAYGFLKTYQWNKVFSQDEHYCLACLYSQNLLKDLHGQDLKIKERILWEDDYWLIVVVYAPEADGEIRIIPKRHVASLYELNDSEIESLAAALIFSNTIQTKFIKKWGKDYFLHLDRNILFRQLPLQTNNDFHFFIDIVPIQQIGGAERSDDHKISQVTPEEITEKMRSFIN
ncbi:hypothetical protein [Candidatus Hodarchaeum mangrovi]